MVEGDCCRNNVKVFRECAISVIQHLTLQAITFWIMAENALSVNARMTTFSDGCMILYVCDEMDEAELYDGGGVQEMSFDDSYRDVVFSETPINLVTPFGLLEDNFELTAPVTVGQIMDVIGDFYSKCITEADYARQIAKGYISKEEYPDWETFADIFVCLGDLNGIHRYYDGLYYDDKTSSYIVSFGS